MKGSKGAIASQHFT